MQITHLQFQFLKRNCQIRIFLSSVSTELHDFLTVTGISTTSASSNPLHSSSTMYLQYLLYTVPPTPCQCYSSATSFSHDSYDGLKTHKNRVGRNIARKKIIQHINLFIISPYVLAKQLVGILRTGVMYIMFNLQSYIKPNQRRISAEASLKNIRNPASSSQDLYHFNTSLYALYCSFGSHRVQNS